MKVTRYGLMPAALGVAALLAACGGGSGGTVAGTPPPTVQTQDVPVTVVDGALQNALVCLDKDASGTCDDGEPSGRTDAAGNVVLKVDAADVGKYPVLALVGTDAVDADNGPVTTPFVLKAPADKQAVVSPLTTLVQATIENTGASSDDAAAAVQAQIGANVSLFSDFTKDSSADGARLATLARIIVVTTQEQAKGLADAVGTTALDGKPVTQQDIDQAITQRLLQNLPDVVNALSDARIAGGSADAATIVLVAQELAASPSLAMTAATVQTLVAVARSTDSAPETATPSATASLASLAYADATHWTRRVFTSTAAQNAPDSQGMTRFVDRHQRNVGGAVANWGFNNGDVTRQNDVHWNGSAWVRCAFNQESQSGTRDAQGRSPYNYCDGFETGVSQRTSVDVTGRAMIDVVNQITGGGYTNVGITDAATVLGSAAFPAGSTLFLQVNSPLSNAPVYVANLSSRVRDTRADVASGDAVACPTITPSTPLGSYTTPTTSFEGMVAANPGTPCVYQANASTGSRNEWWGQSTLSVGTVGDAPVGGTQASYYTTNVMLRVAFGAGATTRYFSCQQRASDGAPRNCDSIGTGTYTVETLGDARVMRLLNPPPQFAALTYQRVFVERDGHVQYGYQNRTTPAGSARLNLVALNALSAQLGLDPVDPDVPLALTRTSYQGDWIVSDQAPDVTNGTTIRIPANGSAAVCLDQGQPFDCTVTLDPATGAMTFAGPDGTATGSFDIDTGTAAGTFTPTTGSPMAFTGLRR
jgi:hypothetical protein